jgi:hypothetical protein
MTSFMMRRSPNVGSSSVGSAVRSAARLPLLRAALVALVALGLDEVGELLAHLLDVELGRATPSVNLEERRAAAICT